MSENHFLVCADNARNHFLYEDKTRNRNEYHYYLNLQTEDYESDHNIVLLKKNYASFIFIHSKDIRVYLDDYDIVDMLINLKTSNEEIYESIHESFLKFLKGDRFTFKFVMDDLEFEYQGIEYLSTPTSIGCKADVEMHINDFIYLINLILAKESIAIHKDQYAMEKIICKYITLTEHFAISCPIAREILKEHRVHVAKSFADSKYWIARAGDKKFVVDNEVFLKHYKI